MVSAAFMPGQSGRDLSLAPALKRRVDRESTARGRFAVHATAPRSKVITAGHNMHVKSSWESMLQLAVLPQLVNLFQ